MDEINLNNLSSSEISNLKVEKEQELHEALQHKSTIEQERTLKRKEILKLRLELTDLELAYEKESCITQQLRSDLRILTDRFFQARNTEI
jgi:hypothetical protein